MKAFKHIYHLLLILPNAIQRGFWLVISQGRTSRMSSDLVYVIFSLLFWAHRAFYIFPQAASGFYYSLDNPCCFISAQTMVRIFFTCDKALMRFSLGNGYLSVSACNNCCAYFFPDIGFLSTFPHNDDYLIFFQTTASFSIIPRQ